MALLQRILLAAGLSAVLAGLVMTGLHAWKVYPLIHKAEHYEVQTAGHDHAGAAPHDHAGDASGTAAWMPADGLERLTFSILANVLMAFGLSLVLCVMFHLFGVDDWRRGVLWGLGGFAAAHLAPALGLPPQLPGMPQSDLIPRQIWWWGTALATASGMVLLARYPLRWIGAAGMALILLPHLAGAPAPAIIDNPVPSGLANRFVAASLFTNAIFWALLGALSARFMVVFAAQTEKDPAAGDYATR